MWVYLRGGHIYPAWCFESFLDLWRFGVYFTFWKVLGHYNIKYFFFIDSFWWSNFFFWYTNYPFWYYPRFAEWFVLYYCYGSFFFIYLSFALWEVFVVLYSSSLILSLAVSSLLMSLWRHSLLLLWYFWLRVWFWFFLSTFIPLYTLPILFSYCLHFPLEPFTIWSQFFYNFTIYVISKPGFLHCFFSSKYVFVWLWHAL